MPASFFAKTLRRMGFWVVWGVCPGAFVKWGGSVFGCVVGLFFLLLVALLCVFLFFFIYGYAGYGLLCFW